MCNFDQFTVHAFKEILTNLQEIFTYFTNTVALDFIPMCVALASIRMGPYGRHLIAATRSLVSIHLCLDLHRPAHAGDSGLRIITAVLYLFKQLVSACATIPYGI